LAVANRKVRRRIALRHGQIRLIDADFRARKKCRKGTIFLKKVHFGTDGRLSTDLSSNETGWNEGDRQQKSAPDGALAEELP
jgi:hypothetical protein